MTTLYPVSPSFQALHLPAPMAQTFRTLVQFLARQPVATHTEKRETPTAAKRVQMTGSGLRLPLEVENPFNVSSSMCREAIR